MTKSIVKSDMLFSQRMPWLKRIVKSGILYGHRQPWLKSILKSDRLFSTKIKCALPKRANTSRYERAYEKSK